MAACAVSLAPSRASGAKAARHSVPSREREKLTRIDGLAALAARLARELPDVTSVVAVALSARENVLPPPQTSMVFDELPPSSQDDRRPVDPRSGLLAKTRPFVPRADARGTRLA